MSTINKSIGIQKIHIRFISSVNPETEKILTRSMFYNPADKKTEDKTISDPVPIQGGQKEKTEESEYPLFTDEIRFPVEELSKLSRTKLLDFFFTKQQFKKHVHGSVATNEDKRSEIANYNFKVLIRLLLCTSFPIKHNIKDTFSENIKQETSKGQVDTESTFTMVKNIFRTTPQQFCYIKVDGFTYTLLSVTHVNELVNDIYFNQILKTLYAFKLWKDEILKKLNAQKTTISNKLNKLIETYGVKIREELKSSVGGSAGALLTFMSDNKYRSPTTTISTKELIPYLKNIKNAGNEEDTKLNFLKLANFNAKALRKVSAAAYIPYDFTQLPEFTNIMNNSFDLSVIEKQIQGIQKYSTTIKQLNYSKDKLGLLDIDQQQAVEKLKKMNQMTEFIKTAKKIIPYQRQYSNLKLEKALKNYNGNDAESAEFIDFIKFIHDMKSDEKIDEGLLNNKVMIEQLETGIMSVIEDNETIAKDKSQTDVFRLDAKTYYDAFVQFELMKGELNKDNMDEIKCPYKNMTLTNQYNELQNKAENKNPALLYIPQATLDKDMFKKKTNSTRKRSTGRTASQRGNKIGGWLPKQARRRTAKHKKRDKKRIKKDRKKQDTPIDDDDDKSPNASVTNSVDKTPE